MPDPSLLRLSLAAAVPLWAQQLQRTPLKDLLAEGPDLATYLASKGDVLQFRGKKGESAEAFNKFARAVTILSFMPGGITLFEDHYENTHPDGARG